MDKGLPKKLKKNKGYIEVETYRVVFNVYLQSEEQLNEGTQHRSLSVLRWISWPQVLELHWE